MGNGFTPKVKGQTTSLNLANATLVLVSLPAEEWEPRGHIRPLHTALHQLLNSLTHFGNLEDWHVNRNCVLGETLLMTLSRTCSSEAA